MRSTGDPRLQHKQSTPEADRCSLGWNIEQYEHCLKQSRICNSKSDRYKNHDVQACTHFSEKIRQFFLKTLALDAKFVADV